MKLKGACMMAFPLVYIETNIIVLLKITTVKGNIPLLDTTKNMQFREKGSVSSFANYIIFTATIKSQRVIKLHMFCTSELALKNIHFLALFS